MTREWHHLAGALLQAGVHFGLGEPRQKGYELVPPPGLFGGITTGTSFEEELSCFPELIAVTT
jgi:hypothetical protein